ncbi:hypothetical protein ADU37_CDS18140 [Thermococcus sp. 2319x1]|nr:hypothetical protein ADU37_CDS18140 [Thermococcus sp. 2319x1]
MKRYEIKQAVKIDKRVDGNEATLFRFDIVKGKSSEEVEVFGVIEYRCVECGDMLFVFNSKEYEEELNIRGFKILKKVIDWENNRVELVVVLNDLYYNKDRKSLVDLIDEIVEYELMDFGASFAIAKMMIEGKNLEVKY